MLPTPRLFVIAAVAAVSCAIPVARSHPAPFTLEQVMQAPLPSALDASPAGKAVAWVFDAQGCRNIWVADTAHGMKGRQITPFTQDDGFDIGELAWSPDGLWIAFTRGQTLADELPANVGSAADGPFAREVWIVPTSGGEARRIAPGHSAQFSPDGSRLVFIDKQRLLSVAFGGSGPTSGDGGPASPEPLIADKGGVGSFTFAPDGKRLAFISDRGSHSLIGVFEPTSRSIRWLSPSLDHDSSPVFSPDGNRIAFIRVPSQKSPIFISRRTGHPWSIHVADAATGQSRRVWTADAGAGSVFNSTLSEQNLFWSARDQLVFPWEKTGWLQLYTVPAEGGTARSLTSGAFEIGHMAIGPDRRRVVFSSNQDDPDRLHVWSVDPDGGVPERAGANRGVESRGIEDDPQMSADGTVFALRSEGTSPLQPVMSGRAGRWESLAPGSVPASFPNTGLTMPSAVTFPAQDGQAVHAQIFLPKSASELIEALRARSIDHEEIVIPNEIHDLGRFQSWMVLFRATDDYFERHLRGP